MSLSERLAKLDGIMRPVLSNFSPKFYIDFYSKGRKEFLDRLVNETPKNIDVSSWSNPIKVWDIKFNNCIFNAAGMFKKGKGYEVVASQGAGAWLCGTTTSQPRMGNTKNGIVHPFVPLPRSGAAINWLGLPNDGHSAIAGTLKKIERIDGCPIGISVSSDPSESGLHALKSLVEGMNNLAKQNIDFIELNESCPNVSNHTHKDHTILDEEMINRLQYIKDNFLKKRERNLPVIVKYSIDTNESLIGSLVNLLIDLEFDGINLGNTSTKYDEIQKYIDKKEFDQYKYFVENFGGGISGRVLKDKSLKLCKTAHDEIKKSKLKNEFHIIRTGGIETHKDLIDSQNAGVTLNQWYTGYFENFSKFGHNVYKSLISNS
ncbi:quinone-dependent dihydroorotate dehydrogenase [Candidatus Kapaibacterium sp.]